MPDGVKAHRDLVYVGNGHERHKLDLFVPEKADGPLPLIIWVHGGGWQNGSKDGCPPLRDGYTERGYAVASINYRLSGHAVFPAQIEDCKAAIRWLRAHAKEYNLDPQRFGVWGSSAGGHLVALIGTSGDVKEFDVGANLDQSSRVQAVCDYYGPTDFTVFVTTPGYESHATRLIARGETHRRRGDGEQGQGGAREPDHLREQGRSAVSHRAWRQGPHGADQPEPAALRRAEESGRERAFPHHPRRGPRHGLRRTGDRADGERVFRAQLEIRSTRVAAVEAKTSEKPGDAPGRRSLRGLQFPAHPGRHAAEVFPST